MQDDPELPRQSRREFVVAAASLAAAPAVAGAQPGPALVPSAPPSGRDAVSVAAWGARGQNDVADGPRINHALAEAPLGSTLVFPPGIYRTPVTLLQRRQVNIWFEPGAVVLGILPNDGMNLWDVRITEAVLGNRDVRRVRFDNLALEVALETGCNNVFNVENAPPQVANLAMLVMNGRIAGITAQRGAAVRLAGANTQLHTFLHNEIVNQVHLDGASDACRFVYNLVSGEKTGFLVDLAGGAFRTLIAHNVIVARDGAMRVRNGSQIDFLHNQIEQPSAAGANRSPTRSSVEISPQSYLSRQIAVVGNNFGGGELVDVSLHVAGGAVGCEDLVVDGNSFGVTRSGDDIRIADARARGSRIGSANLPRGGRDVAQFTRFPAVRANRLDPGDLLRIVDRGAETYGARKTVNHLVPRNGWSGETLRFWKSLDDELRFSGALGIGVSAPRTPIGLLPPGFRPAAEAVLLVPSDSGAPAAIVIGADGLISVLDAPPRGRLHLDGLRLAVQGRSSYDPGY